VKPIIKADTIKEAKIDAGLSTNQTLKILKHIRADIGVKSIEKGVRESLIEDNSKFRTLFKVDKLNMEVSSGPSKAIPVIYCSNIDDLSLKFINFSAP